MCITQGGGFYLLGVQVAGVLCIITWCAVLSFITLQIIDFTIGLRFPFQEELLGADIVEHSIGPRKYDKIKKRLTDISRVRGYNMQRRRKRYNNASFRAAERYLSQKDAGVLSVDNDPDAQTFGRRVKTKMKGKRGKKSPPYAKKANVFSISNGQRNGVSSHNDKASDYKSHHMTDISIEGMSVAGNMSPRLNRGSPGYRNSMTRLHGALRRRRVSKVPKWQQQLGVDNLAFMDQEDDDDINGFITHPVTIEINSGVDDSVNKATQSNKVGSRESSANDVNLHMKDINLTTIKPRGAMVDGCTQTMRVQFEQESECCSHCQQTMRADDDESEHGELQSEMSSAKVELNSVYVHSIEVLNSEIHEERNDDDTESVFHFDITDDGNQLDGPEQIV